MSIDRDRVRQRAAYVRDQIVALRTLPERTSREAFVTDPYLPAAARYKLQTAIEALIDIAFHLSAKLAQYAPQDAQDAFAAMARLGILQAADMPRFRDMLRFRNRVVHGYLDVSDEQLYEMMSGQDLVDLEVVLAAFERAAR